MELVSNANDLSLGELMARFLAHKRNQVQSGDLSLRTLGDYIVAIENFVSFQKHGMLASRLKPEHFSGYVRLLLEKRKLGRHARKRVRAYVNTFLHFGSGNGWFTMPATGVDWKAPSTDLDSIRQAKARAGIADYSERIFTGYEIDTLLSKATPTFKALILLGVNAGLGTADLARLRWHMIDLKTGKLTFPRPKTGVKRVCYLWKKTRKALERVSKLKRNCMAIEKEGDGALVFISREGHSYYRDIEKSKEVEINGIKVRKLIGVQTQNSISSTFYRMCRDAKLTGASFYRCRHTFRSLAASARDREAVHLMMGHSASIMSRVYDHSQVSFERIKRVAKIVHRKLWGFKPKARTNQVMTNEMKVSSDGEMAERIPG